MLRRWLQWAAYPSLVYRLGLCARLRLQPSRRLAITATRPLSVSSQRCIRAPPSRWATRVLHSTIIYLHERLHMLLFGYLQDEQSEVHRMLIDEMLDLLSSSVRISIYFQAGDKEDIGDGISAVGGANWSNEGLSSYLVCLAEAPGATPTAPVDIGIVAVDPSTGKVLYDEFRHVSV